MPEMIEIDDLVIFECLNCGYRTKGRRGEEIICPKCQPDFKGWFRTLIDSKYNNRSKRNG
jgi:hypothetical protein